MFHKTAVIIFNIAGGNFTADLEIPLEISAHELVLALNEAFALGIDTLDTRNCYLKASNPPALLKGSRTLAEFGVRNGTVITHEIQDHNF